METSRDLPYSRDEKKRMKEIRQIGGSRLELRDAE